MTVINIIKLGGGLLLKELKAPVIVPGLIKYFPSKLYTPLIWVNPLINISHSNF